MVGGGEVTRADGQEVDWMAGRSIPELASGPVPACTPPRFPFLIPRSTEPHRNLREPWWGG